MDTDEDAGSGDDVEALAVEAESLGELHVDPWRLERERPVVGGGDLGDLVLHLRVGAHHRRVQPDGAVGAVDADLAVAERDHVLAEWFAFEDAEEVRQQEHRRKDRFDDAVLVVLAEATFVLADAFLVDFRQHLVFEDPLCFFLPAVAVLVGFAYRCGGQGRSVVASDVIDERDDFLGCDHLVAASWVVSMRVVMRARCA